jgi:hypothetical protein
MPPFSAGLALDPYLTPPQLVYPPSFPFKKTFYVSNAIWYSVLEFDVWTSYETGPDLADVRINGVSVGRIPPRSYAQNGVELAPVAILFGNGMLKVLGAYGRTGNNELEIVPPTANDYLTVGNWRIHFHQHLEP